MKILLAYISGAVDRRDPYLNLLPTGLCSLHSCLRAAGYDSLLANFSGWTDADILQQVERLQPVLVGISQWTHNRHASLSLAKLIRTKCPGCTIIMGGAHASLAYEDILFPDSPVDGVVVGEGEETLLELAGCLREGRPWHGIPGTVCREGDAICPAPPRLLLQDLDSLPSCSAYLDHTVGVDLQLQPEFIITARGCPSACSFCSSPRFWNRKVRFRSPRNIVEEMVHIRDTYGLIYFSLRDDTFTADRARTIAFCRYLVENRIYLLWNCQSRVSVLDEELLIWMKRAGCECIQLGVESGAPRILSRLGKGITPEQVERASELIRKVGINLSIYLISDVPGESEEDLKQTVALIRRIAPDDGYVSPLAYFPGTKLFNDAVTAGTISRDIFRNDPHDAVYASATPGRGSGRLLRALGQSVPRDPARFRRQKGLLGYCFTTNVLAGEFYRQSGDGLAAEREFREITVCEPDNPWGWYLLAECYRESGAQKEAHDCFRQVCRIVPRHGASSEALRVQKKRG